MSARIPVGAVVLGIVAVIAAVLGDLALLMFAIVVAVATGGEMYRAARLRGARPIALVGLLAIASMLIAVYLAERESALPIVVAGAVGASFVMMLMRRRRRDVTQALVHTMLPVMLVGLLAAYVVAVRVALKPDNGDLIITLLLIAIASDVGAAIVASRGEQPVARAWWRRLLGALGGGLIAAFVAVLLPFPISWGRAVALAIVVAPAVTVADAIAAMVEQDLDLARAHLLRRVDGVLFAAPVFFYTFQVLSR